MLWWILRNRSPFRRLEEDEEARREGFERPRHRHTLFTRALRYGALGLLGYFGARAVFRSEWGRRQWSAVRERYPAPFDLTDRWIRSGVERFVDWTLEEASRHPGMPRHRPILVAAQGVQFASRRIEQSLMARTAVEQLRFSAYEKERIIQLSKLMGYDDLDQTREFVGQVIEKGLFEGLFATRTRRSYILSWRGIFQDTPEFLSNLLLTSPSFSSYRHTLKSLGLSNEQIDAITQGYIAPLVQDVVRDIPRGFFETGEVQERLRKIYQRAAMSREIDDSPLVRMLGARGYRPINMLQALGYGYTINDPEIARAFRYVSPEHYEYLDISLYPHELPSELRSAYERYRNQLVTMGEIRDRDQLERSRRALDEMADKDERLALGRFLYLREKYRNQLLSQMFDLAGMERPRRRYQSIPPQAWDDPLEYSELEDTTEEGFDPALVEEARSRLMSIPVSTMMVSPDTGRVIDISYVQGALEYGRQGATMFGLPVAPGMFLLQPLRMFPWFRPNVDWFVHVDPTARQPVLAEAMGKSPGEQLGEDVFILGGRAFRARGEFFSPVEEVHPGAVSYPFAYRNMRAVMERIEGDWTSMRVEGMTMRGMMDSLINAREGTWQESMRLRMEESWFVRARRRFFHDPEDLSDPRSVWARLTRDDAYIETPLDVDMSRLVSQMMTKFGYRMDFDEISFLREFVKVRDEIRRRRLAGHPAFEAMQDPSLIAQAEMEMMGQPEINTYNWDDVFSVLSKAGNLEEALGLFMRHEDLEPLREALHAVMYPHSASDAGIRYAMGLGLFDPGLSILPFGKGDMTPFTLSVKSAAFMNLVNMRSSLFQYLSQHYTPDRPESLIDPVYGTIFGVPESKLRFSELVRAMVLESSIQELSRTLEADDLLLAALEASRRTGSKEAASWFIGSLFREAAEADPSTGVVGTHGMGNILMLRKMALSGQIGELYRWGFHAFEEELNRQWGGLNVIDNLEVDDDPASRSYVFVVRRGPRFGSKEWFAGYLNRWGKVEDESDIYRYFVGWRLNEMLKPYGLSLNETSMSSGGRIIRDIALYRLLPAVGGYLAWRYVNTEMRNLFGYAPADLLADTMRVGQLGATSLMDVTGITSLKKFLVQEIPGLDQYFHPRTADELEFYHRYGLSAIRYGRGWLSGSRSAFVGEGVQANLPTWYRGMRSYWQAAPNADIATLAAHTRGDIPIPTPRNPLAPVFYVVRRSLGISDRQWAERHRHDRPYPIAYRGMEVVRSGPVRSEEYEVVPPRPVIGFGAVPSVRGAGRLVAYDGADAVVGWRAGAGINFRSFMLSVGMSPRLREELVTAPGAEGASVGGTPVQVGSALVETAQVSTRTVIHQVSEIQGIYGWLSRLVSDAFLARENPIVTESPGWAYSGQRRFWESLYGGLDILPWHNELNELLRRFVPKRRPTEYVYYNPIPNNMPYWIPERLRYGDPYVRIFGGELRLPGASYRWANPARFGVSRPGPHDIRDTDLLTLPAEALAMDGERQFAVLSGMSRVVGVRTDLPDKVIDRVVRRYIGQFTEDVPIYRNVITRDDENRVSAYTMLMIGEGRRANIVHAVPSGMDLDAARVGMMERMRQLGVRRGELLVVEDEQTGAYRRMLVRRDDRVLRPHLERWRRFREALIGDIESGVVNEGLFYSPLQRFEILADVAPKSSYFRRLKAELSSRQHQMTDEERRRFEYAQEVAERTGERYHLYPYRVAPLEATEARALGLDEEGRLLVEGRQDAVRLAGIRLRLSEIKRRYGLAQNAPREEALRRLSEEFGLTGEVELLHSGIRSRRAPRYIVRARGRDVNRALLRAGLAVRDEEDESMEARHLRRGPFRRLFTRLVDWVTHLDTPIHTKFLRVRSPLEEWERGHVFGTRAGSWEAPFSTYIKPSITAIVNKSPVYAALSGAILGTMFGFTVGAKEQGAMYGAMIGAGLSIARMVVAPRGYIPSRTRKRWEIDEYIDLLQYTKYMRLARQESELAKRLEGTDVDQLLREMDEQDRETERRRRQLESRLDRVRRRLASRPSERLKEEESRILAELERLQSEPENRRRRRRRRGVNLMDLGEHARRALLYRAMAAQTAFGTGTAQRPGDALRTVRPHVRDIYRQVLETATPRERRRFYELLPDYHKVVFHDLLAPELPLPKRQDPTRLFRKFGLPGPSWRGWDPDVDLELLRSHLVESGGLDAIDAGVFPTERAVSRVVLDEIGVPTPTSSHLVAARLASLFGEGNMQRVFGATAPTSLGSSYYTYVDYYDREYEKNVYKHYIRSLSAIA